MKDEASLHGSLYPGGQNSALYTGLKPGMSGMGLEAAQDEPLTLMIADSRPAVATHAARLGVLRIELSPAVLTQ